MIGYPENEPRDRGNKNSPRKRNKKIFSIFVLKREREVLIFKLKKCLGPSQLPRGLKHKTSSPTHILQFCVRIPLQVGYLHSVFLLSRVGSGFMTD
jgi:hypothetical protein